MNTVVCTNIRNVVLQGKLKHPKLYWFRTTINFWLHELRCKRRLFAVTDARLAEHLRQLNKSTLCHMVKLTIIALPETKHDEIFTIILSFVKQRLIE